MRLLLPVFIALTALASVFAAPRASASVDADSGDHLVIAGVAHVRAGTTFVVSVTAVDASGSLDTTFSGNVSLSAVAFGGSNFTGGAQTQAAANGVATFNVALNNAADNYQITATSGLFQAATSNLFNVTATQLSIAPIVSVRSGVPFSATVQALDANNNVAENFFGAVTLDASTGNGTNFPADPSTTATAGVATFNGLVLRDAANGYILTASAAGLAGDSTSFGVTADHLVVSPVANIRAGTTFSATVTARDANNNTAENFAGTISVSAAATGGSNFTGGAQFVTANDGVATVNGLVLSDAADGYTLGASAAGMNATSNSFNVTATHLAVLTVPSVRSGTPFTVTVHALDANGNIAENFTGVVTLDASTGHGTNFSVDPVANAAAGVATFGGLVLSDAADGYVVTATSPGLMFDLKSFNVTASSLALSAVSNMRAGTTFSASVTALDANGDLAENFAASVSLDASATGGSNFSGGTKTITAAGGTVTFTGLALNDAANGYTLRASASDIEGTSNAFDVTATHLAVAAVPSVRSGAPFTVTVNGLDANGNRAENFTGTVVLDARTGNGTNFAVGPSVGASAGVATFSGLVLNDAADGYILSATSTGLIADSTSFNVTANALSVSAVSDMVAGQTFSVTVTARDANGNAAENFRGTISVDASATGGSNFNGTHSTTAVAGVATLSGLALNDAANGYTVDAAAGDIAGTSNAFNVTFATLVVGPVSSNVRAGQPFDVTVTALDANGNTAENFSGFVSLDAAAIGGSNFSGGARRATAVAGVATFTGLQLPDAADGYRLTASGANTAGVQTAVSGTFNVTASVLTTSTVADTIGGAAFSVTVTAVDATGSVAENFNNSVSVDASAVGGSTFAGGTQSATAMAGVATFDALVLNTAANGYTITASGGGLTATSNAFNIADPTPHVSIADVRVTEGDSGTTAAIFTVMLTNRSQRTLTLSFATANASATADADYIAATGTLTFLPGTTSQTITVTINGDVLNEADETFAVQLSNVVNGIIDDAVGIGTIVNDDPLPTIAIADASATEGTATARQATIDVQLSAPSGQTVTVQFATADGTAVDGVGEAGADYVATSGTIVFAPGETTKTITVTLTNDTTREADEWFYIDLTAPMNATLARARATVTIVDDDDPSILLADLRQYVQNLGLTKGRTQSLLAKLRNDCGSVAAFINEVNAQTGKDISVATADVLTTRARAVQIALRCQALS